MDLRWQAAAGLSTGAEAFHPTVLPGQRNRLRASARPRRLLQDTRAAARQAGAMGNRARVLDSTARYDAVATPDTVSQLRAAIRKLLVVLDSLAPQLASAVRRALSRDDDYSRLGKPPCDWDDRAAREELVDELVHDALATLAALEGAELPPPARDAADLLAVAGQDVGQGDDGTFRIVKKVAKDRVISTVDPEARHGHKSANRHFDGYKAHICIDPESELIDEVTITPANAPDAQAVACLLASHADDGEKPEVVGDSAYGSAAARSDLEAQGDAVTAKAAPVRNSTGGFTKEDFHIDPLALTLRMGLHLYAGELSAVASLNAQVKAGTEATASQLAPYGALLLAGWQGREAEAFQVIEATIEEVVPRGEALGLTATQWATAVIYNGLGRYQDALVAAEQASERAEDPGVLQLEPGRARRGGCSQRRARGRCRCPRASHAGHAPLRH